VPIAFAAPLVDPPGQTQRLLDRLRPRVGEHLSRVGARGQFREPFPQAQPGRAVEVRAVDERHLLHLVAHRSLHPWMAVTEVHVDRTGAGIENHPPGAGAQEAAGPRDDL
jgi:hypothetical protein